MYMMNSHTRLIVAIGMLCASVFDDALSFVLEGTSTSYAQFRKWNAGLNGTLEFEFKTDQGSGLLLYTDDGGTYDFFEIKLVESALRLRYNLGGGAQIVTVGRDLGDGHWHKVQVTRDNENTTLTVDGTSATSTSRGKEFEFGKLNGNSDVYVGGMPSWYNSKLTLLALPSVIFEPRFNGIIRNLVYADGETIMSRRQEMKSRDPKCTGYPCVESISSKRKPPRSLRSMIVTNVTDACEVHDPCQHGGICISTDSGPICECRTGDYEGVYCEKEAWSTVLPTAGTDEFWEWDYNKAPSEATFKGTEYLTIDLSKAEPVMSTQESISIYFKTRQPNGLLFYSGEAGDYLTISLKDGGAAVGMTLANGRLDLHIKPARVRFDDNQWHRIVVHRRVQEISTITSFCRLSAVVDGVFADHGHTAGSFSRLASDRLFVGGGADARSLHGAKGINNFVGCLRKVEIAAEGVRMELIEAAKSGAAGAAAWGRIEFHCQEPKASDPVTFTTRDSHLKASPVSSRRLHGALVTFTSPESHLVLPPWKAAKSGSISFKIRTNEPNGLVMYSKSGGHTRPDLFAFEILGGHLYLHADLGSGPIKVRASRRRVDDSAWHDVALRRVERDGRLTVDGVTTEFRTPGDSTQLDLDSLLYIGGVGAPFAPLTIPPVLWSGSLRQGYVGCLRDLVINGNPVDIAGYAQQQDSGAVRPACHVQSPHCASEPCMHGGHCLEGWNRFHCDCTGTPFTGPTCGKDASTLHLNGTQQMTALMPEDSRTQAEEVVVRFKTAKSRGLLIATSLENSSDRLQLSLEEGKAKMLIHIGDREKVVMVGQGLNDDTWHTLKFSRRATSLKLQVNDEPAVRAETLLGKQSILEFRTLHVGGYLHAEHDTPHFVGQLQQVWFNGYPYLEIARSAGSHQGSHQGVTPIIRVTGKFGKRNHPVHHPVTFTSKHTFVGLPVLKAYVETNVYFQFKTREANGLLLYNAGRERDFVAIELVNGHVHYVFDLGDGPVRIKDTSRSRLNDGKWHAVSIARPAPKRHTLAVDDHVAAVNSPGSNENLDLDGILYIGGVEKSQYGQLPKNILSRHGFEGCLASLDLSGESPDLLSDAVVPSSLVESGCDAPNSHPGKRCTHDVCANHGTCVQQWNSYTCDCDMTSFTGPTCSDEATAYEFGAGRGLITYTFPADRRPEMKRDMIAMGFATGISDAVLMRIESASSNDYLEIEIVEGNVFAVYNMGTNDHPIGEVGVKVNDNQYHVVRLSRSGPNSTLQVDDYNLQSNHPSGHQLTVFNSQATIQIGGRWNRSKNRVERPFLGVVSGVVVNGARILDLTAARDPRTSTRGDVQLLPTGSLLDRAAPLQRMQQTPASGLPGVVDDLIFSGAGSGCAGDDEDEECSPILESGSDDLITPVYVAPTRSPAVTPRPKGPNKESPERPSCDDEEDCYDGSGGDPLTTEEIFVTAATDPSAGSYTTLRASPTSQSTTQTLPGSPSTPSRGGTDLVSTQYAGTTQFNATSPGADSSHDSTVTHRVTSSTGTPSQTTSTTGMMEPPPPPPPPIYTPISTQRPGPGKEIRITSEAAENAALIIGIIAGALIAIVLIILIILKFKNRPEASYKIDESKNFCQDPNAALLGSAAGAGQPFNGALKNGASVSKNVRKQELKDIKEWYV
ncbi:neurexin-1 isoform X2 [Neodiprion lecontei]|uniref:Neurexin-1 isoform X2 n=1 Tax=Neodiprion lecontei TaxID=441921 RepID=A0ABM3GKX5_NEOLC|nr:neurexin-1 isoform X2 [Neodiprion lecontei]